MNVLFIVGLLFFVPLLLFVVWLALSSCLGDSLRPNQRSGNSTWASSRRQRQMERDRDRDIAASRHALYEGMRDNYGGSWEVMEMQDMMGPRKDEELRS
ncbi:hypothetical protein TWF569_000513 [Orbilia oligospora]|uniref:Uncharacterized protein n=1 Tax=Orbilia oligospora TaxID=2813651 RepID=A0A7C8PSF7_ORBOL|nr:hypothetical protein TWF706_004157 [Orbilia oligospora]KAF3120280.1 hypothetical protein TWF703_002659 [Orbilia oligospora]KAF3126629.1 hypothetical protein TWF569_000513 [Orbilia oligospora]KAF3148272.1 hypothetical protein TWF594_001461 [Orbilia oligospora]KAF3177891.1 hypothetical protein TWF751_001845 [Orbilia oligospora]